MQEPFLRWITPADVVARQAVVRGSGIFSRSHTVCISNYISGVVGMSMSYPSVAVGMFEALAIQCSRDSLKHVEKMPALAAMQYGIHRSLLRLNPLAHALQQQAP